MSINRVQKLLFSEYCDFEDMVLVESPFAQTTKDGRGIRQVYLGLTPSKLVLATDVLPPVEKSCTRFLPGIDPDIETFELIAIYPVECVNLSVFSKHKRQSLKAHFCNNKVLYFELGGFDKRDMFWNLWQERIRFLSPDDSASSKSQTSVASSSSTTSSTMYLVDSREITKRNGVKQIWCKFGTGNNSESSLMKKWTDRYLYLGKSYEESYSHYLPKMRKPSVRQFVRSASPTRNIVTASQSDVSNPISPKTSRSKTVNRFGMGIRDNCSTTLLMADEMERDAIFIPQKEFFVMAEECVRQWEMNSNVAERTHHKRLSGLCPYPYLLYGLGPWNVHPGCRYSIQVKRAVSTITIKRQPVENELRLPISKRQLLATISFDALNTDRFTDRLTTNRMPVILFWTPCYWYRPRNAKYAYDELRKHLSGIKERRERKYGKRKFMGKMSWKRKFRPRSESTSDVDIDYSTEKKLPHRSNGGRYTTIKNVTAWCFLFLDGLSSSRTNKKAKPLEEIKRALRLDLTLTAWDFDSNTLAQQLTLIDRELFVRVTNIEMGIVIAQESSKNAPNLSAVIAFAHRISCLIANEILREETEKVRARLISRFIIVADKCHHLSNYQSCKSVLLGLQNMAIFRLRKTWAYVKKKHASSYQVFEYLSKLYKDVRLPAYQNSFYLAIQEAPYLPQIADVLARLLDRVPNYRLVPSRVANNMNISCVKKHFSGRNFGSYNRNDSTPFSRLFSSIKHKIHHTQEQDDRSKWEKEVRDSTRKKPYMLKALHDYFRPLEFYEDHKIRCLKETTKFLQNCQLAVMSYSFNTNALAREYLLKARYREDKENFYVSLNIEPPFYNDKLSNKMK